MAVPKKIANRIASTSCLVVATAMAAASGHADEFKMKDKPKTFPAKPSIFRGEFLGIGDGKLQYQPPMGDANSGSGPQTVVQFGGAGLAQLGPSSKVPTLALRDLESITFDGQNDWLSVTMKNGDFIRGKDESLAKGTLRLKNVEKPIRLIYVKEIIATEEPDQKTPE